MNGKFQSTAVFTPRTGGVKGTQCPCAGAPAGMILDLAHALRGGVLRGVAPSRVHECRRDCQLHVKEFATFGSACRQHEELDTHHKLPRQTAARGCAARAIREWRNSRRVGDTAGRPGRPQADGEEGGQV